MMTVGDLIALLEKHPSDTRVLISASHAAGMIDIEGIESVEAKQYFGPDHGGRFFHAESNPDGAFPAILIE